MGASLQGGERGVLVSRHSVLKLDTYYACTLTLPEDREAVVRFLDYEIIDDPELTPASMLVTFDQIRSHAALWPELRIENKRISHDLMVHAKGIQEQGAEVEVLARQTHALGPDPAEWMDISRSLDQQLDMHDRVVLEKMASVFDSLRSQVNAFDRAADQVNTRLQMFRDEARLTLIPAVLRKGRALRRWPDRRKAINDSLWLLIIAFTERIDISASIEDVEKITLLVHHVEQELSEVVIESGKLHSVWQAIDSYLESSASRLRSMEGQQNLAKFMLYYKLFLAQWEGVERHAREAFAIIE